MLLWNKTKKPLGLKRKYRGTLKDAAEYFGADGFVERQTENDIYRDFKNECEYTKGEYIKEAIFYYILAPIGSFFEEYGLTILKVVGIILGIVLAIFLVLVAVQFIIDVVIFLVGIIFNFIGALFNFIINLPFYLIQLALWIVHAFFSLITGNGIPPLVFYPMFD